MRISDWSSDVCSSDLLDRVAPGLEDSVDVAHDGRVLDKTFNRRRALQQATEALCPWAVESALAERRGGKTRMEGSIDLFDARSRLDIPQDAEAVLSQLFVGFGRGQDAAPCDRGHDRSPHAAAGRSARPTGRKMPLSRNCSRVRRSEEHTSEL